MSKSEEISALALDVQQTEHTYLLHGDRYNPVTTPWMPYQPADFIGILWECMPELTEVVAPDAPTFLDVGCGPGTKMQIASTLFGFNVFGVEVDEEMAAEAADKFPDKVLTGDAMAVLPWDFLRFDVIWLYRPFRDAVREIQLETAVISKMKPGAILAGSSWEVDVSALGWNPVVDDCLISPDGKNQIIRGAWQKPRSAAGRGM